ncbi:GntR family transcriptional regulator [Peribacillus sp. FSL E2-0218]|uniref:GntR family transcriptional regulator n=1 Tax=Peribacillus sp. FSL E2-0218 TaxID=2921364 RepID=UPI0030EBB72A
MNKYEQISIEIRKRIKQGFYRTDQPIPDEITLAKEFECSRMTMKRGLDILVEEGLLFRKRGHGTFIVQSPVNDEKVNVISEETLGLSNVLPNRKVSSTLIAFDVQFPEKEVADQLAISEDTPVYHIIRLRNVDNEPYVIEKTYMPVSTIQGITERVLQASIYNYIHETLELKIGGAHRKIRADKPNELDQIHLGCLPDDPILEVEQVGYLNNGLPFEYSFSRHRYDKFVFTTVTIRK